MLNIILILQKIYLTSFTTIKDCTSKNIAQQEVERNYRLPAMEQDVRSTHCYVEDYETLRGKVILDMGAAEGIFALNAIDYAEHLFLFECEKDWIAPLEATFESMKDKITIVEKLSVM